RRDQFRAEEGTQRDVRFEHGAFGACVVRTGRSAGGPAGRPRSGTTDGRWGMELPRDAGVFGRHARVVSYDDIGVGGAAGVRAIPAGTGRTGARGAGARTRVSAGTPAVPVASDGGGSEGGDDTIRVSSAVALRCTARLGLFPRLRRSARR